MVAANDSCLNNAAFKIGLVTLMFFSSCQSNSKGDLRKSMFFSLYDSSQSIIGKDYYKMEWFARGKNLDSLVVIDKEGNSFNFLQHKDFSKISLVCEGKKFPIYTVEDTLVHDIPNQYCNVYPPFINRNTSYRSTKTYVVNNREYSVHHFVADNGIDSKTYDYYALEKVGPICLYSFDSNEYLICDSLNAFQISNVELRALTGKLTTDSLFFSKFFLEKYLPNFHRPIYK
mgnify:CR=1 FL=1